MRHTRPPTPTPPTRPASRTRTAPLAGLLGLAILIGGCDALGPSAGSYMSRLDGTWSRTLTTEEIGVDGTVTPTGEPRTDVYRIGQSFTCQGGTFIRSEGEDNRIASAAPTAEQNGACQVISVDGGVQRIVFVGVTFDGAGTIIENTGNRQVWHVYGPRTDGTALRTVWTLTR